MAAETSALRNREHWVRMMDDILLAIGQSLQRTPEVPPSPLPQSPEIFPALQSLDQDLLHLQGLVDQAEEAVQQIDGELSAIAGGLRQWLGQEPGQPAA